MSSLGAPSPRYLHTAVWNGSQMIVWGGGDILIPLYDGDGGVFDPATDTWRTTSTIGAPGGRAAHTAVWTGSKMIVWGGGDFYSRIDYGDGGIYDPRINTWTATTTKGAPSPRTGHAAVWTGSTMIVWGGGELHAGAYHGDGGIYDPRTTTWAAMSQKDAPSARSWHTMTWTGSRAIVWGGWDAAGLLGTGGVYDPASDRWTKMSSLGAPSPRARHTAVWTGSRMIVWGGHGPASNTPGDGGIYDPVWDTWEPTQTTDAPISRSGHTTTWTRTLMLVWGGEDPNLPISYQTGGLYDPKTGSWTATTTAGAPSPRWGATSVWTGSSVIVWGGAQSTLPGAHDDGAIYEDSTFVAPPAQYYTIAPCRVIDTRDPDGPLGGPILGPTTIRPFTVAGRACGIPQGAVAVSANVAPVGPTAAGFLILFPGDVLVPPVASTVTFAAGQTRSSNAIVTLAANGTGTVQVKNGSVGAVHVVLDVNGYFE